VGPSGATPACYLPQRRYTAVANSIDMRLDGRGSWRRGKRPSTRFSATQRGEPGIDSSLRATVTDATLTIGIVLSPSSQLRLYGSPIGPGELFLLISLLLTFGCVVIRGSWPLTPALSRLAIFWAIFAIALSIGTITAAALQDRHDPGLFLHDVLAYSLAAAISCMIAAELDNPLRLRRIVWFLVTFGAMSLAMQLLDASGVVSLTKSDPWYWVRFRGWSENPAQLAFLCAALGSLSLHLADTASGGAEWLLAVASVTLAVYVGRLTKTDTFVLAMLAASAVFISIKLKTWLSSAGRTRSARFAAAWTTVLALPLVVASAVPLAPVIATHLASVAKTLSKDDGKSAGRETALRLHLWGEAWSRGLESGMLGLGPGPHLPIPPSLVLARATDATAPKNIQHPTLNGTPNFEAHNTIFDLFMQGGVIAVFDVLWITGTALVGAYNLRLAGLVALLSSLLCFALFDMVARYPVFCCVVALCLGSIPSMRPAAVAKRS
jgi:hypothetical protein